jgi:hypothetical protein
MLVGTRPEELLSHGYTAMLVIQPPVIFSIFTQHLIRIIALEVLATRSGQHLTL